MSRLTLFLAWFATVVAALLVGRLVAGLVTRRPLGRTALTAWIAAGLNASLLWLVLPADRWRASSVRLDSPGQGAEIEGATTTVTGTVVPAGAHVTVLVSPEKANGRWWVQREVSPDPRSGAWSVVAELGTEEEGGGETFALVAAATSEPWFLRLLGNRRHVPGRTLTAPPPGAQSDVVLVRRAK